MGFNLGVSANINNSKTLLECDKFLERTFYYWVSEFDIYGEQSCIIQTGKYFGLDLIPLTNIIYTNDELVEDCIQSGLQSTDFLVKLVNELILKITTNRLFIDKIKYDVSNFPNDKEGEINPWREYVIEGEFLEHLNTLKESLECFKLKGHDEVFLTAG